MVLDTLMIAGIESISIIIISSLTAIIAFYKGKSFLNKFTDLASTGYAFPGTMLAIGILVFIGLIDNFYSLIASGIFGNFNSGVLSGTILVLILVLLN